MSKFEKLVADAIAQHHAGNLEKAEARYRAALAIVPGHVVVLHNLGVVLAAQKKERFAIELFNEVIAAQRKLLGDQQRCQSESAKRRAFDLPNTPAG